MNLQILKQKSHLIIICIWIILFSFFELIKVQFFALDFFSSTLFYFFEFAVLPLVLIYLFKLKFSENGLTLNNWKSSLKFFAIFFLLALPIMFFAARMPEFNSFYPLIKEAKTSWQIFLVMEFFILLSMFATEFFFRGFLYFNLEKIFGWQLAVVLQAIPYALTHVGKPFLEVPYSFFVGIIFALIVYRTRSILFPLMLHFLGSMIFDLIIIFIQN